MLLSTERDGIIKLSNENSLDECIQESEKGDGTMSAVTQNYVYNYGKKQDGKKEHTVSSEKLKEMKASLAKLLSSKEQ